MRSVPNVVPACRKCTELVLRVRRYEAKDRGRPDLTEQTDRTMASTDTTTSSEPLEHKRSVDEAFLNKLKSLVERLRLDNANLKRALDVERGEVRVLKARHDSAIRHLKTEYRRKEELLEKQLRTAPKQEKAEDNQISCNKMVELKRLTTEIQSLKSANRGLQEKLKVR